MSYKQGTDLGYLRELLGDTNPDDELFSDEYLQGLIDRYGANGIAATLALYRVLNDPELLKRRYRRFGPLSPDVLAELRRSLLEEIDHLKIVGALPDTLEFEPAPNQWGTGRTTNEDGWYVRQGIDDYLRSK